MLRINGKNIFEDEHLYTRVHDGFEMRRGYISCPVR